MNTSVDHFESVNNDDDFCREASSDETASFLMDDGPVLKTVWTVYDRQFDDGQRELCVTRTTRIKQNGPLAMPTRAKRGESEKRTANDEDSAKRAKQAVRLRCKTISADRMLTLTYRDNITDMDKVKKDWDAFRRRMSRAGKFHYVATIEKQERGAFHIHVAVKGRMLYQLVRQIWWDIVGLDAEGRHNGNIDVRNPHKLGFGKTGAHQLASYIAKYIAKDIDAHELNKRRYWSSKGIVVPEKNYYQLPYGTDASGAFTHIMHIAASWNNDGMTFFSNQALGVCWVATAGVVPTRGTEPE